MLLTSTSAQAIRAMIYLARQPSGWFCQARKISECEQIPNPFLWKILRQLRRHHLVESVRGSKGGYRLRAAPSKIHLIEIVEAIDGETEMDRCVLHEARCGREGYCSLHQRLQPILEQFRSALGNTTLEAISQPRVIVPTQRPDRKRNRRHLSGGM